MATEGMEMEASSSTSEPQAKPQFAPIKVGEKLDRKEFRRVPVPLNRRSGLRREWQKIIAPIVEQLKLQIRYNIKKNQVELKVSPETTTTTALQKGADFLKAYMLGFEVGDAMAVIRLDDCFVESFDIKDVKSLKGDHLGRAIGRLAGRNGKTRFSLENATRTRIVVANTKVHILGSYQGIQKARRAICALIMGSPPAKIYGKLRALQSASRM